MRLFDVCPCYSLVNKAGSKYLTSLNHPSHSFSDEIICDLEQGAGYLNFRTHMFNFFPVGACISNYARVTFCQTRFLQDYILNFLVVTPQPTSKVLNTIKLQCTKKLLTMVCQLSWGSWFWPQNPHHNDKRFPKELNSLHAWHLCQNLTPTTIDLDLWWWYFNHFDVIYHLSNAF